MEESFITIIELKGFMSKEIYCKRCGALHELHFQIQLTPSRLINVCTTCFDWARNKTPTEIRKDYTEKVRRRKK